MNQNLRNSGIDIIGDVPWGTHFCQFYQTKEDLMDVLIPYFKAGLENNEFCMWVTSQPLDVEEAKEALRKAVPDLDIYIEKGQIEIIPYTQWYVKEGVFDSNRVLNGWVEKLNQALANGYDGLRLTGNTFWLEKEDWNDFVDYEEEVDRVLGNYQMIALCTYCLDRCNAKEIIDVVVNHQFALIKREGKWEQIESSKRKQVEEVQRQSEEKYHNLFMNMTEEVHFWKLVRDEEGLVKTWQLVDANPPTLKTWNKTLEEIQGKTTDEIFGTGATEHYMPIVQKIMSEGVPYAYEDYFPHLDKHFRFTSVPLRGYFITTGADITAIKKTNEALREAYEILQVQNEELQSQSEEIQMQSEELQAQSEELHVQNEELQAQSEELREAYETLHESEEHYRMLFTNMTEAFYLTDIIYYKDGRPCDYHFLEVNPAYELLMGVKKEQMLGRSLFEVFPNANPTTFEKYNEIAISGQSAHFEVFSQAVNSKYLDVYAFSPEKGKLAVIFRDITKRKQAEAKLKETLDNLEEKVKERTAELEEAYNLLMESEEKYRSLFENMAEGFTMYEVILDSEGKLDDLHFVELNKVSEQTIGIPRDKILGNTRKHLFPQTNPVYWGGITKTVSTGQPQLLEWYSQTRCIWFETYSYVPKPVTIAVLFREITERKKAEQKIQALANAVESSNDAISDAIS